MDVVMRAEQKPPAAPPVVLLPAAVPVVVEAVVPAPAPPPPRTPPAPAARRTVKPLPASLAALLESPAALRNAIILREIFDPPLCKRPR